MGDCIKHFVYDNKLNINEFYKQNEKVLLILARLETVTV